MFSSANERHYKRRPFPGAKNEGVACGEVQVQREPSLPRTALGKGRGTEISRGRANSRALGRHGDGHPPCRRSYPGMWCYLKLKAIVLNLQDRRGDDEAELCRSTMSFSLANYFSIRAKDHSVQLRPLLRPCARRALKRRGSPGHLRSTASTASTETENNSTIPGASIF